MGEKFDRHIHCAHAVGVDQKDLLLHREGFTSDINCDTMGIILFNYCPYCGLNLRKERQNAKGKKIDVGTRKSLHHQDRSRNISYSGENKIGS